MLEITAIPALKDNYIWMIRHTDSTQVYVVDPGLSMPVINILQKENLTLAGILLTHHHHDHSGGISELLSYAGNIPVYGSYQSKTQVVNHPLKTNDTFLIANTSFRALEIPGHTLDHTAFYSEGILFSGDTLFSMGCGRVFEGTYQQMHDSLMRLAALPDNTKLYCGHEYTLANLAFAQHVEPDNHALAEKKLALTHACTLPSLLGEEKCLNPFLRCHTDDIAHAISQKVNKPLNNSVEVFQYLREWKNQF